MTPSKSVRRIALIAHDNCKTALVAWVEKHREKMRDCELLATGTTGSLIQASTGFAVTVFQSGPLGGDQQIGALISEGRVDMLVFFWILWSLCPMIRTSRPCCASRRCGICPRRVTRRPPIFLSSRHDFTITNHRDLISRTTSTVPWAVGSSPPNAMTRILLE